MVSQYRHSRETGVRLCEELGIDSGADSDFAIYPTLTPNSEEFAPQSLLDPYPELVERKSAKLLLVGHEPRLRQLVTAFTGERIEPLERLDMLAITAATSADLLLGGGNISWRYPVRNLMEAELRQKISSKMTVATFLAGFTFTALGMVFTLLLPGAIDAGADSNLTHYLEFTVTGAWCAYVRAVAFLLLTAALGCFVSAVYVYDCLSMPQGLWDSEGKETWWFSRISSSTAFLDNKKRNGYVYAHMVMAWSRLFTPAVWLAAFGFGLIVGTLSLPLAGAYVLVLASVVMWSRANGPVIGVD